LSGIPDINTQLFGIISVLLVVIEFLVIFWEVRKNRDKNREGRDGGTND
jgi:hypothetical protein